MVTGLLLTVAIFCKNMSDSRDSLLEETRRDDVIKPPQITPAHHISWSRCQQNMSVANIKNFSALPDHIKDLISVEELKGPRMFFFCWSLKALL